MSQALAVEATNKVAAEPRRDATDNAHEGMGAIPHDGGVAFRVWAPHADAVSVVGDFTGWKAEAAVPMQAEEGGYWYVDLPQASIGSEYQYVIRNGDRELWRIDPYARQVTNSVGHAVVHDLDFDWQGDDFVMPPWNELVLYELHVGTFNRIEGEPVGTFASAGEKLGHLRDLGVNVVQLMPCAEFAGDQSWGYNPAHPFAVESAYGGPRALKEFVLAAHAEGIGVMCDVVYNHFGPSDLHLWQFDGWSENGKGGIYFYNDWKSTTPWGDTRPDYGRGEVRLYIRDNAMMWLDDYHVDGLRYDMTLYMRSAHGTGENDIPDGWSLAQWVNREVLERHPRHLTVAEDLQNDDRLTKPGEHGGANFGAQWDAGFVHPVRDVMSQLEDAHRSMEKLRGAILHRYNLDVFERVVYSESHDEVANGKARLPSEVNPDDPEAWEARKRSLLAAVLVFTAPGIPMLFQGQEFLREGWFDDGNPLDWDRAAEFPGILRAYRDLARLRRNLDGRTNGLTGQHVEVQHFNDTDKLIAFRRWKDGGPGDETLVVCNVSTNARTDYQIGVSAEGEWKLRFNSDGTAYGDDLGETPSFSSRAIAEPRDGQPATLTVDIAPYSALIFSQDH